jgi:hypothetical protein
MKDPSIDELAEQLTDFAVQESTAGRPPREARIVSGFEEIQRFISEHGRVPQGDTASSIFERLYAVRLDRMRFLEECRTLLGAMDDGRILGDKERASGSVSDSDVDELAAELEGTASSDDITAIRHVRLTADKRVSEAMADRKPCKEFSAFERLFKRFEADVHTGLRQSRPIEAGNRSIKQGDVFVLDGIMLYVAEVGEPLKTTGREVDRRLRVVFANGTESNLLLRSLQRAFYDDPSARRLVAPETGQLSLGGEFEADDVESGTVYVLRSLSEDAYIAKNRELIHKIGVTGGRVETRIASAEHDATYLLAKVEVVATYRLAGLNRSRMERLFHRLFSSARLNITIKDRFGRPVQPKEWFLVPLFVINEAVQRISDGSIVDYVYDPKAAQLVKASRTAILG